MASDTVQVKTAREFTPEGLRREIAELEAWMAAYAGDKASRAWRYATEELDLLKRELEMVLL